MAKADNGEKNNKTETDNSEHYPIIFLHTQNLRNSKIVSQTYSSAPTPLATNPNPNPTLLPPPPTLHFLAGTPPQVPGVLPPSFRPLGPQVPQFSPVPAPNPAYHNPAVPPPGVPGATVAVPPPQMQAMMSYQVQPGNPAMRPFAPIPNGYAAAPNVTPAGGSFIQSFVVPL